MKALKLLTMMFPIHLSATLMTMMITCWRDVVATNNNAVEICEVPTSDTTKIKSGLSNSAFVFVKPHANTGATRELVEEKLKNAGIEILEEKTIDGKTIDKKGLIDQHYYSIASKATMLAPRDIPVPTDKFENAFGESWSTVLAEDRACNAMEACKRFECTPSELNEAWQQVDAVKFGGGFYCGTFPFHLLLTTLVFGSVHVWNDKNEHMFLYFFISSIFFPLFCGGWEQNKLLLLFLYLLKGRLSVNGKPELYVFNAFFMKMRSNYIGDDNSIHCYIVKWDPTVLSWTSFRNEVLG